MLARRCELESVVSAAGSGHGVVAGVDVDGFAGDGPGEVGEQEADGVGDGGRVVGVPGQRGGGGPGVQEPIEARYGVGGSGVEGPGGDEVDPDLVGDRKSTRMHSSHVFATRITSFA